MVKFTYPTAVATIYQTIIIVKAQHIKCARETLTPVEQELYALVTLKCRIALMIYFMVFAYNVICS